MSAIALIRLPPPRPSAFVFPFAPAEVQREIGVYGGKTVERIRFSALLDATDGLERGMPDAATYGIRPELAALELLLRERRRLLLVWGERRLVVSLDALSIQETEFDRVLNPIRATVALSMTVGDGAAAAAGADLAPAVGGVGTAGTGLASGFSGPVHAAEPAPAQTRKSRGAADPWTASVEQVDAQRRAQLAARAFVDVAWKGEDGSPKPGKRTR